MLDLISILFQATVFLRVYKERLTTTLNYTYHNLEIACNKLSTVKQIPVPGPLLGSYSLWF